MRSLIDAARQKGDMQTIFITPQSMSAIPSGADIRAFKLRPPDRTGNQGTLDEGFAAAAAAAAAAPGDDD